VDDSNRELQEKEALLRNTILKDLGQIVEKIGKEEKFSLILEKNDSLLLYAADTIDLTEIVIKQYDAQSRRK
jgi:outer membrane protein